MTRGEMLRVPTAHIVNATIMPPAHVLTPVVTIATYADGSNLSSDPTDLI